MIAYCLSNFVDAAPTRTEPSRSLGMLCLCTTYLMHVHICRVRGVVYVTGLGSFIPFFRSFYTLSSSVLHTCIFMYIAQSLTLSVHVQ